MQSQYIGPSKIKLCEELYLEFNYLSYRLKSTAYRQTMRKVR